MHLEERYNSEKDRETARRQSQEGGSARDTRENDGKENKDRLKKEPR